MPRLIDADRLKQVIADNVYPVQDAFNSRDYGMFWTGGIEKAIDEIPTVDAEPVRHGKWTHNKWSNMRHDYICSLCGCRISGVDPFSLSATAYYYCPECGARMDEVEDG